MASSHLINGLSTGSDNQAATGFSNGSSFELLTPSPGTTSPQGVSSLNDISLEQALFRVQELAKENAELRDFMRENNMKMKQQYDLLSQWKQKVHETNNINKEKFEQTRILISSLREDNAELQKQISEFKKQIANFEKQISDVQDEKKYLQNQVRLLEDEKEALQRATIASSHVIQDLREQATEQGVNVSGGEELDMYQDSIVYVAKSAEREQQIQELEADNQHLRNDYSKAVEQQHALEEENRRFRDSVENLLHDLENTQKLKEELQSENEKLGQENASLLQHVQELLGDAKASVNSERETANLLGIKAEVKEERELLEEQQQQKVLLEGAKSTKGLEIAQMERELLNANADLKTIQNSNSELEKKVHSLQATMEEQRKEMEVAQQQHWEEMSRMSKLHEEKLTTMARQQETPRQMSVSEANNNDIHTLRSQVLTLISEVTELNSKLTAATNACDKKEQRLKVAEQREHQFLEEQKSQRQIIASLQAGLHNTQRRLQYEQGLHETTKKQMNDLRESFNQLVSDYKELLENFDQYKDQYLEQEHSKESERLSQLTAQILAAEETLAVKDEQIKKLRDEILSLRREYDNNVAVLQAQADIFRADFDAERQAREKQVAEKDKIVDEMNNLQIRNQQLLDELDSFSRRQLSEMQRRHGPTPQNFIPVTSGSFSPHPNFNYVGPAGDISAGDLLCQTAQPVYPRLNQPSQHDEEDDISCPKCFLHFPDFDTLQLHVMDCVDDQIH